MKSFHKIFAFSLLLVFIFSCSSCSAASKNKKSPRVQSPNYTITRWEYNPDTDTLDIDVNFKKDGSLFHTYHLPALYEDAEDRSVFFVKSIPARTLFTLPDDLPDEEEWRIDCDPSYAESVGGSGYRNGGAIVFGDNESVFFNGATGMTIYYKYDLEPFYPSENVQRPVFTPQKLVKNAKHQVTKCEWNKDTKRFRFEVDGKKKLDTELENEFGQDNYVNVEVDAGTQFTIPYGWFIDCSIANTKSISGKGESLNNGGGIRYYEGATVLFKKKAKMTIRQLYRF